jgi:hypothetical protein
MHDKYTTLRRRLRLITRLASEEPLSFDTQDAIAIEAHHALNDVDELCEPTTTIHELKPITLRLVEDERQEATR